MKIAAVLHNTFKRNFATSRSVDLTSFGGENNRSQTSSITDKNANETIKNNSTSYITFLGRTVTYYDIPDNSSYYSTSGSVKVVTEGEHRIEATAYWSYGGRNTDSTFNSAARYAIMNHPYLQKNSSIEETNNNYRTKRIYFADPEEGVNAQTKKDHDFIVYDNRPNYPNLNGVRENYYNTDRNAQNYGETFKDIAEYYYRLEMADKKEYDKLVQERKDFQPEYDRSRAYKMTIDERIENMPWESKDVKQNKEKADYFYSINHERMEKLNQDIGYYNDRIEFSKKQQGLAIEAFRLFDEVGLMFMERDNARNQIQRYKDTSRYYEEEIPNWQEELDAKTKEKETYEAEKRELEEQVQTIEKYKEIRSRNNSRSTTEMDEDLKMLNDKLYTNKWNLKHATNKVEEYTKKIKDAKDYIAEGKARIPELQKLFEEKSEEIKPYYAKMEEFYKKNIEDWQCSQYWS